MKTIGSPTYSSVAIPVQTNIDHLSHVMCDECKEWFLRDDINWLTGQPGESEAICNNCIPPGLHIERNPSGLKYLRETRE